MSGQWRAWKIQYMKLCRGEFINISHPASQGLYIISAIGSLKPTFPSLLELMVTASNPFLIVNLLIKEAHWTWDARSSRRGESKVHGLESPYSHLCLTKVWLTYPTSVVVLFRHWLGRPRPIRACQNLKMSLAGFRERNYKLCFAGLIMDERQRICCIERWGFVVSRGAELSQGDRGDRRREHFSCREEHRLRNCQSLRLEQSRVASKTI